MGYNCVICHNSVSVEEIEEEKAYTVTTEFGDIVGCIHNECIEITSSLISCEKLNR